MTDALAPATNEKDFAKTFSRLALQLRWLDADQAAVSSYYQALRDIPLSILNASALRLANEPGRRFFPTTGEWRNIALLIEQEHLRAEQNRIGRVWVLECEQCEDTGWIYHTCEKNECGRDRPHAVPHSYVTQCFCRPTNRTFQRNHRPKKDTA